MKPVFLALWFSLFCGAALAATELPTQKAESNEVEAINPVEEKPEREKAEPKKAKPAGGKTSEVYDRNAERINAIEHYLSSLTTVISEFSQVAPDGGVSNGKFYMKRPGRMRWQYAPPTPVLMVSDGKVFTYYDYELEQVSYLPLDDSLIGFLAQEDIVFSGSISVEAFESANGVTRVTLVQTEKPTDGKLMLEFSAAPLQLKGMVVTDSSGQVTTVSLQNAKFGTPLKKELFVFKDPRKRKRI